MPLTVGARVVLGGLSRADLNGQLATVTEVATKDDPSRAGVRLDATRQVLAIRRTNLQSSPDEAQHNLVTVGTRVVLVGLPRADLNGQVATVAEVAMRDDPERARVWLATSGQGLVIRRTNLRASPDEACLPKVEQRAWRRTIVAGAGADDQQKYCHAAALMKEGHGLKGRGDARGALAKYEECCACGRTIRSAHLSQEVESTALGDLGEAYFSLGQFAEAIRIHERQLAIARENGLRKLEAQCLSNLGLSYESLEDYATAFVHHDQAYGVVLKIDDRPLEGIIRNNLGNACRSLKQYDKAIAHYDRALPIAREIGDRKAEGRCLGSLGRTYFDLKQLDKAIAHFKQALAIAREIGDREAEGHNLSNLGSAYRESERHAEAVRHFNQALPIYRGIGDRRAEVRCLDQIGVGYRALEWHAAAITHHNQALGLALEIGDRPLEGIIRSNLGNAYFTPGYAEDVGVARGAKCAIEQYEQAIAIACALGDQQQEANCRRNLGTAHRLLEQHVDAPPVRKDVQQAAEKQRAATAAAAEVAAAAATAAKKDRAAAVAAVQAVAAGPGTAEAAVTQHTRETLAQHVGASVVGTIKEARAIAYVEERVRVGRRPAGERWRPRPVAEEVDDY